MDVRVRFTPELSRYADMGSMRAALFNWLFARHHGGILVLSIQDTGQQGLSVAPALEPIYDSLRWLGLDWDEGPDKGGDYGPYTASERRSLYRAYAQRLIDAGQAYPCFCSSTLPDSAPALAADRCSRCRTLTAREQETLLAQGITPDIRFKCPQAGQTRVSDLVFQQKQVDNDSLGDVVLLRSEGLPTRHLANVIDDHLMAITHVIRDAQWLPDTPYQALVCQAFGWAVPEFAHLPAIDYGKGVLGTSLPIYQDQGYLAPALVNHLARLGWSPRGKRQLADMDELAARFDLGRVSSSPVTFELSGLEWFNHRHLCQMAIADLTQLLIPRWQEAYGASHRAEDTALTPDLWQQKLALAIRDELGNLAQAPAHVRFCFVDRVSQQPDAAKTLAQPYAPDILRAFVDSIADLEPFLYEPIDRLVTSLRYRFKTSHGIRSRDVMFVIRAALTGRLDGPCLVSVCELLGRRRCIERAQAAQ